MHYTAFSEQLRVLAMRMAVLVKSGVKSRLDETPTKLGGVLIQSKDLSRLRLSQPCGGSCL